MSAIPPGFGPNLPVFNDDSGNPPTFFMDAIAQERRDAAAGYSSLDPSTIGGSGSGLIDLIKQLDREHRGGQTPPLSGVNIDGAPIRMGSSAASAHKAGEANLHKQPRAVDRVLSVLRSDTEQGAQLRAALAKNGMTIEDVEADQKTIHKVLDPNGQASAPGRINSED